MQSTYRCSWRNIARKFDVGQSPCDIESTVTRKILRELQFRSLLTQLWKFWDFFFSYAGQHCAYYFLFNEGDNLHRVVLCANQYATDHVNGWGCLILFVFILLHFAQSSTFSQYSECVHCFCVQNLHILPCARHTVQGKCARHTVQGNATDHLEGTRLHRACTRAWLANIYIRHAQVANWRVICFWAPSMHRGTSGSR